MVGSWELAPLFHVYELGRFMLLDLVVPLPCSVLSSIPRDESNTDLGCFPVWAAMNSGSQSILEHVLWFTCVCIFNMYLKVRWLNPNCYCQAAF